LSSWAFFENYCKMSEPGFNRLQDLLEYFSKKNEIDIRYSEKSLH
jgi:hypothetical protein